MPEYRILVDMDGVLSNFVKRAGEVFGLSEEALGRMLYESKTYHIPHVLGKSAKDFWSSIENHGEPFWSKMDKYPWAERLLDELSELPIDSQRYIVTSPSLSPVCASGKVKWMQEHIHPRFRNFALTPQKHLMADKHTILIDDSMDNCSKFERYGGQAIIFPQAWNIMRDVEEDKVDYTITAIKSILEIE